MNFCDALELCKTLFCIAMVCGVVWVGTGYWNLERRGRVPWVYTLNRIAFWSWIILLFLTGVSWLETL